MLNRSAGILPATVYGGSVGETGVQCQDESGLKSRDARERAHTPPFKGGTKKHATALTRFSRCIGLELNRGRNNRVLLEAKFILSVLAGAVHLALSYPERPA